MKMNKFVLGILAIGALVFGATSAQSQDYFAVPREVILSAPATLSTIGNNTTTNGPIDVRQFDGKLRVNIFSLTNGTGGGTATATLETSDNPTNSWVAIPNYALAIATSVSYTNYYNGTSNVVSQTIQLPGTVTYPTASSGFITPYLSPALYTNSGAITITTKGYYTVAYPVDDGKQYVHIIWAQAGGAGTTNGTFGATVIGSSGFNP